MFCSKCGSETSDTAKFCHKCGNKMTYAGSSSDNKEFSLTINREKQWFAINPAMNILIDKKYEYKIENGKSLTVPVSSGRHNLIFSFSICNKIVDIDVVGDLILTVKWNRVSGDLEVN